jgi:hypothetical protein
MIRTLRYCGTLRNMRAETVDLDLPRHVAQERLMKAVREGREGFVAGDLARLDSGTIPLTKIEALFEPAEIKVAIARRRKRLIEELKDLDRLVPNARRESFVSGDRTVVTTATAETADWSDLADYDARQMGGDERTKATHRSTDRVRKSIDAMKAAAAELDRAGGR